MANKKIAGVGTLTDKGAVKLTTAAAKAAGHRNAQGVDSPRNAEVRATQRKAISRASAEAGIKGPIEVFDRDVQVDEVE